ncbi:MAG: hypothetical protein K9L86_05720 [Candidatus Omnitrophica bacterium]|nr:hypothetical protein [Candidatus Omnitrophota bacterium]
MKKINKIFFVLICVLCSAQLALYAEYNSTLLKHHIQFSPPTGWNQISLGPFAADIEGIAFRSPDEKAVITVSLPKKTNFISFHGALILFRLSKRPKEEKITFCDESCYIFDFEQINKNNIKVLTKTYKFLKKNKLYTISYYSSPNEYRQYLPEFKKALATFKIIE